MSTVLFVIGEGNLSDHHDDLKAFVLQDEAIETTQSEDYYRELLHNHENDIFILKKDTTIQFSTDKWREKFGYIKEDIDGENFFTLVHPKDLPFFANEMVELVNDNHENSSIGPFRLKNSEGQYELYMAHGIPLSSEKHDIVGIGLILTDVSIPVGGESGMPAALAYSSIDLQ